MTVSVPAPPPVQDRPILAGRSALVTGAGPAGVATARALASAGASGWLDRIVPRFDPEAVLPEPLSVRERPAEA
jgi:NAD(P)-dependent dehydrogenase (short-subunit alcohol dehydrogenase family)